MAESATALVVRLEARFDNLEKGLKQAGVLADDAVRSIEDKFAKSNPKWAVAAGSALGDLFTGALQEASKFLDTLVERFKKIESAAELTGISLRDAFAVEQVLGSGALEGLEKVATQLDRMQRGEKNYLSKLFDANGVKNARDAATAFERVVDIVQRAPNLIQAREIGAGVGIDAETVAKIREAKGEFGALRQEAAAAAPDLEKIARLARDFDEMWGKALKAVKAYVVENVREMARPIAEFVESTVQELRQLLEAIAGVGNFFGRDTSGIQKWVGQLNEAGQTLRGFIDKGGPLEVDVEKRSDRPSRPPSLGGGGGGGRERLNALQREGQRATERTAQMELEARLVGATVEQRTRELELLRLTQMAEREKITITDDVRKNIERQADAYGKAAAVLDEANRKQREFVELQNFAGNTLVSALDRAAAGGAKFADIMDDVVSSLRRAALQALLLGQGPLAGLFGTAPASGQSVGGVMGAVAGLIPRRAGGGSVEVGRLYRVNEMGTELFVPRTPGIVIPSQAASRAGNGNAPSVIVNNNGPPLGPVSAEFSPDGQAIMLRIAAATVEGNNQRRDFARRSPRKM